MTTRHSNRQPANHLLRCVSRAEQQRLLDKMERIELIPRRVLYDPDKPIEYVFFPEDGVVSLVRSMQDGPVLEIATIGKEGMVGLPVFLGAVSSPLQAFAQVPGHALQMSTADFKREVMNGFGLRRILERYTQALFTQLSQSVACNRVHSIEQRCARWLLFTGDRIKDSQFMLTQEFLAQMLGVRRASVNGFLQDFQRKGMIEYKQGQMQIKNRRKLEAVSCECYFVVRKEYQKLTGAS